MPGISFKYYGVKKVQSYLRNIAHGIRLVAMQALGEYLIGDQQHGLRHYSPYRYITLKRAYGGFVSDAQRRYVMAMIREGRIDPGAPHRTGQIQRGWKLIAADESRSFRLVNDAPGVAYVMGNQTQANLPRLAGWRTVSEVIADNIKGAIRHANAVIRDWLRSQK